MRYTARDGSQFLSVCPRGFCNETTIYRVHPGRIAEAEAAYENYEDDVERGGYTNWLKYAPDHRKVIAWSECPMASNRQ